MQVRTDGALSGFPFHGCVTNRKYSFSCGNCIVSDGAPDCSFAVYGNALTAFVDQPKLVLDLNPQNTKDWISLPIFTMNQLSLNTFPDPRTKMLLPPAGSTHTRDSPKSTIPKPKTPVKAPAKPTQTSPTKSSAQSRQTGRKTSVFPVSAFNESPRIDLA